MTCRRCKGKVVMDEELFRNVIKMFQQGGKVEGVIEQIKKDLEEPIII